MEIEKSCGMTQPLANFIMNIKKFESEEKAVEAYDEIEKAIELTKSQMEAEAPGNKRISQVQKEIALVVESDRKHMGHKLSCRKGCSACCNIKVEISPEEGDLIADFVKKNNIEVDLERAKIQEGFSIEDYSKNFFSGKARCLFLNDEGDCKIYRIRPIACRLHTSVDPKENCEPDSNGVAKKHQKPVFVGGELLYSAYISVTGHENCESLSAAMLRRLDNGKT